LTSGTSQELGIHAQSIQEVCRRFVQSRDQHRKRPKFRSNKKSLGWVPFQKQSRQLTESSVIYLGHEFKVFGSKKRPIPVETAKGGCFVKDSLGQWWVCIYVNIKQNTTGQGSVGIDLGLKNLATTSNGEIFENPKIFYRYQEKLARSQRAGKKEKTTRIHHKIKNIRQDFLHKASSKLTKDNKFIAVGNVSSSKLTKTKFSKAVYDVSWFAFKEMLRYKASRHGATYLEVDEAFTTQTCSHCGNYTSEGRPKGIRRSWNKILELFFLWGDPRPRCERGQEYPQDRAECPASCGGKPD
jgi:putative transposase